MYKVRNPENRPDEVSVMRAGGNWRVFIREGGHFEVHTFPVEEAAIAFAETHRHRLNLIKLDTLSFG